FSWQLRRLAQVARLSRQGLSLAAAMDRAGVPNYPAARKGTEQLVRHLGWRRLEKLYDWLLDADLGLKGGSALPPRVLLERPARPTSRRNRGPSPSPGTNCWGSWGGAAWASSTGPGRRG